MTPEEARMRAYALVGHEDIMLEWIDREGIESQGIGWYVWNNLDLQAGCIFVGRWKTNQTNNLTNTHKKDNHTNEETNTRFGRRK